MPNAGYPGQRAEARWGGSRPTGVRDGARGEKRRRERAQAAGKRSSPPNRDGYAGRGELALLVQRTLPAIVDVRCSNGQGDFPISQVGSRYLVHPCCCINSDSKAQSSMLAAIIGW